jgi:predicted choloylglycine hydrolase
MVVAECIPGKVNVRTPEKGGNFIVAANHFTSDGMKVHEIGNRDEYYSEERYESACNALLNGKSKDGTAYAMEILSGKYGFMCQYPKSSGCDTIWSSVFDITNRRIFRAEGNPKRSRFKEDKRLWKERKGMRGNSESLSFSQ